jgi:TldD protein
VNAALNVDDALRETLTWLTRDPRVRYAEVRFTDETAQSLRVRATRESGRSDSVTSSRSTGVGIRVLGEKTWGFASTPRLDAGSLRAAAERAAAIAAAASRIAKSAVPFPARPAQHGTYATPGARDPFAVPVDERLATLERAVLLLLGDAPVVSAEAHADASRTDKRLLTTEGTDVTQTILLGACNMHVIAVDASGQPESRSFPAWSGCDAFQGGWERVLALDLAGNAPRVREELLELCRAPLCPAGERDVILESSQVALQVHESCGHPTELDRALGTEITLAGGSFLDPGKLGTLRYGSPLVTITADAIAPGGAGTFGWDDEGTPAGKSPLVDRGLFVDFLSSRETAAAIDRASTGTMRASGWDRTPLIRMTNVSLAPQSGSLEDLVADTKDGLYIATDRSWSIDDQRLDFQFSCELAWEIKNGKRTRMLRRPLYGGTTPIFWGSCDAVCGPEDFTLWGISSCGKGDPMQLMYVGHGAAPARFRGVRVGSAS